MKEYFKKYNISNRFRIIAVVVLILLLSSVTYYYIQCLANTSKPLVKVLDLRQDSVSMSLIKELKTKGIALGSISAYSDISNTFVKNESKLVLVIQDNNESSTENETELISELFANNLDNISPDALISITKELIEGYLVKNNLKGAIFLNKFYIL